MTSIRNQRFKHIKACIKFEKAESMIYGIFHPKSLQNPSRYIFDHNLHLFRKFRPKIDENEKDMLKNVIFQISKFPFWDSLKKTATVIQLCNFCRSGL